MKSKELARSALLAAIICICAPWAVPIGPVPITLATFAVYLTSAAMGKKSGTLAVVIYLLIGAVGIPVFSNFSGGVQQVLGVTGGFLVGYIPCAFLTGFITDKLPEKFWAYPLGMVVGTIVLYALGTVWFMATTGNGFVASLAICVVPFLIGDVIKIAVAAAAAFPLRKALTIYSEKHYSD